MKTIVFAIGLMLAIGTSAVAQEKDGKVEKAAKNVAHATKKGAKAVGNKTAEISSKGVSRISDKVVKDKQGPNGETIYMEDDGRYYWVNKKGRKIYVPAAALKHRYDD